MEKKGSGGAVCVKRTHRGEKCDFSFSFLPAPRFCTFHISRKVCLDSTYTSPRREKEKYLSECQNILIIIKIIAPVECVSNVSAQRSLSLVPNMIVKSSIYEGSMSDCGIPKFQVASTMSPPLCRPSTQGMCSTIYE